MFESDYTIYGKHATYIKYLVNEAKAFKRYIDVYMAGAAIGALYERQAEQTDSTDRARIYSDAFNTEHVKCNELFRTVVLADTTKPWSVEFSFSTSRAIVSATARRKNAASLSPICRACAEISSWYSGVTRRRISMYFA